MAESNVYTPVLTMTTTLDAISPGSEKTKIFVKILQKSPRGFIIGDKIAFKLLEADESTNKHLVVGATVKILNPKIISTDVLKIGSATKIFPWKTGVQEEFVDPPSDHPWMMPLPPPTPMPSPQLGRGGNELQGSSKIKDFANLDKLTVIIKFSIFWLKMFLF